MFFHTEGSFVKSVQKREVTVHFTREGTFHCGNRLHGVFIIPLIQYSFYYTSE
jgi:hypothetical protein